MRNAVLKAIFDHWSRSQNLRFWNRSLIWVPVPQPLQLVAGLRSRSAGARHFEAGSQIKH